MVDTTAVSLRDLIEGRVDNFNPLWSSDLGEMQTDDRSFAFLPGIHTIDTFRHDILIVLTDDKYHLFWKEPGHRTYDEHRTFSTWGALVKYSIWLE